MIGRTELDRQQLRILFRTFFSRLFESDLMPAGLPQVRLVLSAIAAIAMALTVFPISMRLGGMLLVFFQYTLATIALAFIALIIWEGIFPDRRDGRILSALPIRNSTFVVARLSALAALFGVISAGSAALPSVAFTIFGNPLPHFIGLVGAGAFAFFSVVALQCILLNVAGRAVAQRLAIALQIAIVIAILQAPQIDPPRFVRGAAGGGWSAPGAAGWLPSVWFLALFDVLSGRGTASTNQLATIAAIAALGTPLLTILLYAGTYRRLLRRAIEGEPPPTIRSASGLLRATARAALVTVTPHPVSRAVCFFTLQTISRSRRHKMLLAMYVGVAFAIVLSMVVDRVVRRGWPAFATPDAGLLAIPLIFMCLAVVGMRAQLGIPIEIQANWIFRLRESTHRAAAVGGAAMAMIVGVVLPIAALAGIIASALWGWSMAIQHAAFSASLGVLLAQALVVKFEKVPFTCTFMPGASRLRVFWPLYLMLFSMFTFGMGRLQMVTFRSGENLIAETLVVLAGAALLVVVRHVRLRDSTGFLFEERDDNALFEGFRLSESLAAEGARRPRR